MHPFVLLSNHDFLYMTYYDMDCNLRFDICMYLIHTTESWCNELYKNFISECDDIVIWKHGMLLL